MHSKSTQDTWYELWEEAGSRGLDTWYVAEGMDPVRNSDHPVDAGGPTDAGESDDGSG